MFLSTVVAQSITELANDLGLPEANKNSLISAITSTSYSVSNSSTATTIWQDFKHEPQDIDQNSEIEAIRWIDNIILPQITSFIDGKLNATLFPNFSYPFTSALLVEAFPNLLEVSITNILYGWGVCRELAIRYFCLAELFLASDNTSEEYIKKSNEYRNLGETVLSSLLLCLQKTLALVPVDLGGGVTGASKMITFKLRKSGSIQSGNEYSY